MAKFGSDLALSGLKKTYGSVTAVDHVTFRIKEGEMIALLGPSGCGKTTILRMIAGLTECTSGQVLINGREVTNIPAHKRNIGMLFQNYALFPHMTVEENVAFGLKTRRISRTDRIERTRAALDLVQLGQMAARLPSALSGGQQQRVALARAFVIEPSLLLLDEPLGALDKNLREVMQVELRLLQKRLGITAMMVTHDQEEALTMADRIVVLNGGKVIQIGTPTEIYSTPVNRFVAGFIGASNFLQGDVLGHDAAGTRVRLSCGGDVILPQQYTTGVTLQMTVRPEAIDIVAPDRVEPGPVQGCHVTATVEQIIFRGQVTHVHLRTRDGEPLISYLPNRAGNGSVLHFGIGDEVVAAWASGGTHVLAGA